MDKKKNHPPVEVVREMYTAKFVYHDATGRRNGSGSEVYDSVEGFGFGIAAVISNMANRAAHRGNVKHLPESDLYSALLRCHDREGEVYFLSIARDRITLSSYTDERICRKAGNWINGLAAR